MSLKAIMQDLAVQQVAVRDVNPQVFNAPNLPNALETAHLPCRMLFSGDVNGLSAEGAFVALGILRAVTFQITDLFFWQAVAQGIGRSDVEVYLKEYIDNYILMLRDWRDAGQAQAHVTGFRFDVNRLNYPLDSDRWFWGVASLIKVEEFYPT